MEYTNLGRTGLKVSRLCLGTMNFGPETSEPDSFAIMDRALDEGINFFDTANVYGAEAKPAYFQTRATEICIFHGLPPSYRFKDRYAQLNARRFRNPVPS